MKDKTTLWKIQVSNEIPTKLTAQDKSACHTGWNTGMFTRYSITPQVFYVEAEHYFDAREQAKKIVSFTTDAERVNSFVEIDVQPNTYTISLEVRQQENLEGVE